MQLIYEGVDISHRVDIHKCIHRDVSRGRSDSMEIEFEHAADWYAWKPETGDRIEVLQNGYSTGILFLNTILPENGKYRMIATSLPPAAQVKAWQSFENMRLGDIMRACAAQCGMEWALYGLDAGIRYSYLERRNEGCAAFLDRLLGMEGAVLKCVNGRLAGISIIYAQDIAAMQELSISPAQDAARYTHRKAMKYGALHIRTPYADAFAQDSAATGDEHPILTSIPAADNLQAGRWSRGMLLMHNRQAEGLELTTELNIGMTALARINITGGTDADGEWMVDEAEHDFIRERTQARLIRCIRTIG